jgi:hypothetical protein
MSLEVRNKKDMEVSPGPGYYNPVDDNMSDDRSSTNLNKGHKFGRA